MLCATFPHDSGAPYLSAILRLVHRLSTATNYFGEEQLGHRFRGRPADVGCLASEDGLHVDGAVLDEICPVMRNTINGDCNSPNHGRPSHVKPRSKAVLENHTIKCMIRVGLETQTSAARVTC